MQGSHAIRHWAKTQACVALSSGEAELYGIVKACTEGLGVVSLSQELGRKTMLHVLTDSSAAKGTVLRTGTGRLKHVQLNQLWVQERAAAGDFDICKVGRERNVADLMTHHWSAKEGASHLGGLGIDLPIAA